MLELFFGGFVMISERVEKSGVKQNANKAAELK